MFVKQLSPDPFEHIENYELNKIYKVKIGKIDGFWGFRGARTRINNFLHQSELSWTKKIYLQRNCLKLEMK